jgi:hypothetical protein
MHHEMAQVLLIVEIMVVFAVSNAGVERGFSTYNLIVTVLRNRLAQESKEKLMIISSSSKTVAEFEPNDIIQYWQQLSNEDSSMNLFGCSVPSVFNVDRNEMFLKNKKSAASL